MLGYGAAFSLNPKTGVEKVLYSFCDKQNCSDGTNPGFGLTASGGMLYGTTNAGGAYGLGTLFSLDPKSGVEMALHSFGGGDGDGVEPASGLTNVGGVLYGTTSSGGNGTGTVFSFDPKSGVEKVLYAFCESCDGDGVEPAGGVIAVKGTLYGTTSAGGADDFGTVYSLDLKSGAEKLLYSFRGAVAKDGAYPFAGVLDLNGTLYGTTYNFGAQGNGTVFSVNPKTGAEKLLHTFCQKANCPDGAQPRADLLDVNGALYGTTQIGGANNYGIVFAVKP